jgi:hypothetical protein
MNFAAADELHRQKPARLADAVTPRPEALPSMTAGELRDQIAMMWDRLGHTVITSPARLRSGSTADRCSPAGLSFPA